MTTQMKRGRRVWPAAIAAASLTMLTGWIASAAQSGAAATVVAGPVLAPAQEGPEPPPVPLPAAGRPTRLPAEFRGHRIFVEPVTSDGVELLFFTDTTGPTIIYADVFKKVTVKELTKLDGRPAMFLPECRPDGWIPPPLKPNEIIRTVPSTERLRYLSEDCNGILGMQWFLGRMWTFDYPNGRLWLHAPDDYPPHRPAQRVPVGFKTDQAGNRAGGHPRVRVTIADQPVDLLFSTGATVELTDEALERIGDDGGRVRAASFIVESVFTKWQEAHPDWPVIENAEAAEGAPMIQVPQVEVAGYKVGPVWFTRRPDRNYREFLSQFTDRALDGAIGGNALRFFRVTLDYRKAVAIFDIP